MKIKFNTYGTMFFILLLICWTLFINWMQPTTELNILSSMVWGVITWLICSPLSIDDDY